MKILLIKLGILTLILYSFDKSYSNENFILREDYKKNFSEDISSFQNEINKILKENKIPGAAVALVDKNGTIWAQGFGFTSQHSRKKVNIQTLFSIQSQSKIFTTLAVLSLVQEEKLSLNLPIINYLPDMKISDPNGGESLKIITLKHLLSHTSGFAHDAPVGNNNNSNFSFSEHMESILKGTWLQFKPESSVSYSNVGIDLAGYILQLKSKMNFDDAVKQELFIPLEMTNSTFNVLQYLQNKNHAEGLIEGIKEPIINYSFIPSGGMYSSVHDMAHFLQFVLNKGVFKNKKILNENILKEMETIPFPIQNQKEGYALGLWKGIRNHDLYFSHTGRGFGFVNNLEWYPESNIGIIVFTNKYDQKNIDYEISHKIIDKILEKRKNNEFQEIQKMVYGDYISSMSNLKIQKSVEKNSIHLIGDINYGSFGNSIKKVDLILNYIGKNKFYSNELRDYFIFEAKGPTGVPSLQRETDGFIWFLNSSIKTCNSKDSINSNSYEGVYVLKGYGQNRNYRFYIKEGCPFFEDYSLRKINLNTFISPNGKIVEIQDKKLYFANLMMEKED